MELVTGHTGSTHITAEQVSRLLKGVTATDATTVQRLNVGNLAALSYADATMQIATGDMLLDGFHVTFETSESIPLDATVESTNSRIDKIVLEIIQDNTTSYQRAELVIVQGEEAESPTAPDTPTEPDSGTEEFLAVGVIAQVTVTADAITEFTDLTNLYGGNYVELTDYESDKQTLETDITNLQTADTVIKKEVPWYATSDSAESTIAKIATCNQTGFALATGAKVIVKFDYTNTASSPTLNVNDTGDIAIVAYGTTAPELYWVAGDVVEFTYDGTSWVMHPTQGQVNTLNSNLTNLSSSKSNILTTTTTHKNVTFTTSDTSWNMSATLSGYTPLLYGLYHAFSSMLVLQAENVSRSSGSFTISGFGRVDEGSTSLNTYMTLIVLWVKND